MNINKEAKFVQYDILTIMFTGIITHLGEVLKKDQSRLLIKAPTDLIKNLSNGSSIAVDGICLTVVGKKGDSFEIDYMPETRDRTNIQYLKTEDRVNLELPVTPQTLLSGHLVQGHVDGLIKLEKIGDKGNSRILRFLLDPDLSKYLVEKGSIAVNGISLTVIKAGRDYFSVGIIPHTWEKTMLHNIKLGDYLNIEVDIMAKYVDTLLRRGVK